METERFANGKTLNLDLIEALMNIQHYYLPYKGINFNYLQAAHLRNVIDYARTAYRADDTNASFRNFGMRFQGI